jgi:hypothetical protein
VTEFLVQKFAVNSPSAALVKVDSPSIGLDHPKTDNDEVGAKHVQAWGVWKLPLPGAMCSPTQLHVLAH